MSDSVAEDQIAAFVDRILRLKSEADDIAADIKEIYAEAHGNGFNKTRLGEVVTYLRKVEKDKAAVEEAETIRDLYLTAYYSAKNKPHTHAYARGDENDHEEINPKASAVAALRAPEALEEITQTQPAPPAALDLTADPAPSVDSRQVTHSDIGDPISAQMPSVPVEFPADDGIATSVAGQEGIADQQPITFIPRKQLRPLCQNRERCGASGPKECYLCLKAAAQVGAA